MTLRPEEVESLTRLHAFQSSVIPFALYHFNSELYILTSEQQPGSTQAIHIHIIRAPEKIGA